MRWAAIGASAAIALAGCTDPFPPEQPDWITNREPLASCGSETIDDQVVTANVEGRHCLLTALRDGGGAEFISTRTTEGGDLVTSYYRVHGHGTIELFGEARDQFGSRTWERSSCGILVPVDEIDPDRASREHDFIELKCIRLPTP